MSSLSYLIFTVVTLTLTLLVTRYDEPFNLSSKIKGTDEKRSCDLIIGILSGRENLEQRQSLRETWLSTELEDKICVRYFFIVGLTPCFIPPQDRSDTYGCDVLRFKEEKFYEDQPFYLTSITEDVKHGLVYYAIHFYVHHSVLVDKLGVSLSELVTSNQTSVILLDAVLQIAVAKVQFTRVNPDNFVIIKGFAYRSIEPIILPNGFEGILYVSQRTSSKQEFSFGQVNKLDDGGGIIQLTMVEDSLTIPSRFSSQIYHMAVSMRFHIYDKRNFLKRSNESNYRENIWKKQMDDASRILKKEIMDYGDIVLVNVTDVYRHLPQKIVAFANLLNKNFRFKYFLKMDDDTFINLNQLIKYLKEEISPLNMNKMWLGKFRSNWLVQRSGKWKEIVYSSAVYPSFACGSANILSEDLVRWLSTNRENLHSFQGEDVSLGIWLSSLAPNYMQDDRWQCDDGCLDNAFSRGQLNISQMFETWNLMNQKGTLCK